MPEKLSPSRYTFGVYICLLHVKSAVIHYCRCPLCPKIFSLWNRI